MYYYFSSDYPAVIKINGMFYGKIQDVIKPLRIDKNLSPFIEICPLNENGNTVNFILDGEFLTSPPNGVNITDLKGGYLIKFYVRYDKLPFNVITQEKLPHAIATVFTESSLKLSIESQSDFYAETFNINCTDATITPFNINNDRFIAIKLVAHSTTLCVYYLGEKIKKVFCRNVFDFSLSPEFSTTEKFNDIAKHTVLTIWEFCGKEFKVKSASCTKKDGFNTSCLSERLVPYAFLESFLSGDSLDDFLCENVKSNADKLKSYFGNFIGIFPPPVFRDINEIGLIYPLTDNKYEVEYFTFELQDKKISNIAKKDC